MDIEECKKKGMIKKTFVNRSLIKSLIEMSDLKEETVKLSKINEITASSFVSLAYDSLREILEAICALNGYKALSHVCLGELLKEINKDFDHSLFDRLRYIRNGINSYGTKIEPEQGKELISAIFEMKRRLKTQFF